MRRLDSLIACSLLLLAQQACATGPGVAPEPETQRQVEQPGGDVPDAPLYVARDAEPRLTNVHEISQLLDEAYPPRLREERVSGSVALYVLVDKTGRPLRVEVQTPSVHVPFNKAATSVASEMRFEPALNDGEPVGVWILQRLDFNTR